MRTWHILTSSYPPHRGGIGFYSDHLASGFAQRHDEVHVWTAYDLKKTNTVTSYRPTHSLHLNYLGPQWSQDRLQQVAQNILALGGDLIIPYRPKSFPGSIGRELCAFLRTMRRHDVCVHLIIHRSLEWGPWSPHLHWWYSPLMQLSCLHLLMRRCSFVHCTTSHKQRLLWALSWGKNIRTLPVPCHISTQAHATKVRNLRKAFIHEKTLIIGTYSSFIDSSILNILTDALVHLLQKHPTWMWLSFGRFSSPFTKFLHGKLPHLADRIQNAGELDLLSLSAHIQICDLILQAYHHGVNTQRSSAMAALSHGIPLITSSGKKTESIWHTSQCVKLVPWHHTMAYVHAVEELAMHPEQRQALGERGRSTYHSFFSLHTAMTTIYQCSEQYHHQHSLQHPSSSQTSRSKHD